MAAKISSLSDFVDRIHVRHLQLCKSYFDLYVLNYHKTIANGVFVRDLCLLRENNIVADDQDLTS